MIVRQTTLLTYLKATFVYFILQLQDTCCLRDLVLSLPPAASLGQSVVLNCSFHLQGEDLYAIKLYKGRNEFVQFVPDRETPLKIFPLKGVHIENVTLDGSGKVVYGISLILRDVNLFTTGLYGCEGSAEGSFHTDLVRKFMTVVVKPSEAPLLVGFKSRYRVGETLDMQCFINNTYPSANITWFINGIAMEQKYRIDKVIPSEATGLLTTQSDLHLPLSANHFHKGHLTTKCVASLLTMHWQSPDVTIKEEKPTLASVLATKDNSESASHGDDNNDDEEDQRDEDQNSEKDFRNSKDPQLISSGSSKVVLPNLILINLPSLLILVSSFFAHRHSSLTISATALQTNSNFLFLFIQDLGTAAKILLLKIGSKLTLNVQQS